MSINEKIEQLEIEKNKIEKEIFYLNNQKSNIVETVSEGDYYKIQYGFAKVIKVCFNVIDVEEIHTELDLLGEFKESINFINEKTYALDTFNKILLSKIDKKEYDSIKELYDNLFRKIAY